MKITLMVDFGISSVFWEQTEFGEYNMEYDKIKDLLKDSDYIVGIKRLSEDIIKVYYLGDYLLTNKIGDFSEETESFCNSLLIGFVQKIKEYFNQNVLFYVVDNDGSRKSV